MPPYNQPYVPVQRRRLITPQVAPVGPSSAPVPAASPSGGMFSGLLDTANQFRQANPGVLAAYGNSLMQAGGARGAENDQTAALMQKNANYQGMAKYLLDHGLADDPQEAMLLAQNPTLMATLFKDNTIANAAAARQKVAESLGIKPDDPRYPGFVAAGSWDNTPGTSVTAMTPEQRLALYVKNGGDPNSAEARRYALTGSLDSSASRGLTSTQARLQAAAEDAIPAIDNTLSRIDRATELAKSGKVATGFGSDTFARAVVGSKGWLPSMGTGIDPDSAAATKEFNDLLTQDAINEMAITLKGATTNHEMQQFVTVLADPVAPIEQKKRVLQRMRDLAQAQRDTYTTRIQRLDQQESGGDLSGQTVQDPMTPTPPPNASGAGWTVKRIK